MSAIIGFLTALPQLVSLLTQIWSFINKMSGNDPASYLLKVGDAFKLLNAAQTKEEHQDAAKNLADLIASMPPK